jgi:hypothetical protein
LVCLEDRLEPIVRWPTEVSTGPEDFLGVRGEAFRLIEELAMASREELMEFIQLAIELLDGGELEVF